MVLAGDVDAESFGEGLLATGLVAFTTGGDSHPGKDERAAELPVRGVETRASQLCGEEGGVEGGVVGDEERDGTGRCGGLDEGVEALVGGAERWDGGGRFVGWGADERGEVERGGETGGGDVLNGGQGVQVVGEGVLAGGAGVPDEGLVVDVAGGGGGNVVARGRGRSGVGARHGG